ncbi:MAG: PD-(D/E)XK nuclease family protein [Candidatus Hodarchaeales archaeon]
MAVTWTNKHNLPQEFVNALTTDNHVVNGDISVTQLMDAPQIRQLRKTCDYEMDVMDMIGMMIGTAFHDFMERLTFSSNHRARVLEEAAGIFKGLGDDKASAWLLKSADKHFGESINKDVVMEQTLSMEVDGIVISGTFDRYTLSTGMLEDYKTTSANSMMFPETKSSYNEQLNIYRMLMEHNGYEVKSARIIAILKDWSKMKIMQNKDYPRTPVVMMPIKLIEKETVLNHVKKRIALHKRADNGEHIPCTDKDRWKKKDTYKVKKTDGVRSLKNHDSIAMAEKFVSENEFKYPKGLWIETVKAESFRCQNGYCAMSHVCPQYAKEKAEATKSADQMK